jgi:hypothetical protein
MAKRDQMLMRKSDASGYRVARWFTLRREKAHNNEVRDLLASMSLPA